MNRSSLGSLVYVLGSCALTGLAFADVQNIPPGKGLQSAVVVDTGANGICDTTKAGDDIQATPVGQAPSFQKEIRCGANKVADTTAAGDDVQLVPPGGNCQNPNVGVIDTGPNGIADTTAAGDDVQLIAVGTAPPNTPCVLAGADGVANTTAAGDDVQDIAVGTAQVNATVARCGPNGIADTTANNANAGGDDVQLVAVGATCSKNTPVVDSGANGIADTRAEGSDLVLKVMKPIKVSIPAGLATGTKTVKVAVMNEGFGTAEPASRLVSLAVTDGSCPTGTVSQVDIDPATPGGQTTVSIPKGGKSKGSFVVTMHLEDVTTVDKKAPFRCAVNVEADVADDPNLTNAPDDAVNPENNTSAADLEVIDQNDAP